jgi:hypothetical protein
MYQIFFYISGITIIEIGLFFYYVGPMATQIVLSYITHMTTSIIQNLDKPIEHIPKQDTITKGFFSKQNEHQLYVSYLQGKIQRIKYNNELLHTSIFYWVILFTFSIGVLVCKICYSSLCKTKTNRDLVIITSSNDIENNVAYRKNSMDEEDDEVKESITLQETPNKYATCKHNITVNYIVYYTLFCGSIICSQYLFFEYVVFYYQPLSVQEIKYHVYTIVYKS